MDQKTRKTLTHSLIRLPALGAAALFSAIAFSSSPLAAASEHGGGESGAVTGAGFGPTLGVGGPSSYTGGATANHPGGTATQGVGGVNSYTGQGTSGIADNGTNATTRTGNYGPGR